MAISPDAISQAFSGLMGKGGLSFVKYFGYFFWSMLILGGFYAVFVFLQYKIKYTYGIIGSAGTFGKETNIDLTDPKQLAGVTIRGIKSDRIRVIKEGGAIKWKTFFGRETIEPFEYRHVYPNNVVMGVKLGKNLHIPAVFNVGNPHAYVEPVSRSVRFWETVESQQANQEYSDFKTRMLPTFITMGTIILCLILVGLTVWWTTKNIGGGLATVGNQVSTLQQVAQGIAPN